MAQFSIHFLFCNIWISLFICIILLVRRLIRNQLSGSTQYHLWFLLLLLMAVPFIPFRLTIITRFTSWLGRIAAWKFRSSDRWPTAGQLTDTTVQADVMDWMNDFSISVSSRTPSIYGVLFLAIWSAGMFIMLLLTLRSLLHLHRIRQSALPLQNREVRRLFRTCCSDMNITRHIPVYSTAFLKTPVMAGIIHPRIYLPIHLISALGVHYHEKDLRYMLLHELQHYRHRDALVNTITNLAGIVYWFNPLVWYAIREMRNDREIACDSSVLAILDPEDHMDYGNTLIRFAETLSRSPFPFASGMGGDMKQMEKRILSIVSYQPQSFSRRLKGLIAYLLMAVLLAGLVPFLSVEARGSDTYQFHQERDAVSSLDLNSYFDGYQGSFVLYDSAAEHWQIYNEEMAKKRISPDSTYKIYDALLGLESGVITPDHSEMDWNGEIYPFDTWNTNQTLKSAMQNSVNWYFQSIDRQVGVSEVRQYFQDIHYGNQDTSAGLSSYWMESSLKISPIEQVELLKELYNNEFEFRQDHIDTVRDSLYLSSSASRSLYGKTGTGMIDGQNVNGWFVGFIESKKHAYFFAVNIQADENAAGTNAADIALSVLSDLGIWYQ